MKKYLVIIHTAMMESIEARVRMFVYILYDLIPPFISIFLWIGVYRFSGSLSSGWQLKELVTYFLTFTALYSILSQHPEHDISIDAIKQGKLTAHLVKPMSYLVYVFTMEMGWKIIRL